MPKRPKFHQSVAAVVAMMAPLILALPLGGCSATLGAPAVQWCGNFPCGFQFSDFCRSPEGERARVCKSSYAGTVTRSSGDRVYQASLFHDYSMWRFVLYIRADGSAKMYGPNPDAPPKPVSPDAVRRFEETLAEMRFEESPTYTARIESPGIVRMCGFAEYAIERYDDSGFKAVVRDDCVEVQQIAMAWNALIEIAEAAEVDVG